MAVIFLLGKVILHHKFWVSFISTGFASTSLRASIAPLSDNAETRQIFSICTRTLVVLSNIILSRCQIINSTASLIHVWRKTRYKFIPYQNLNALNLFSTRLLGFLFLYCAVVQFHGFLIDNIWLKYYMEYKELQTSYLFINLMNIWLNSPSHSLETYCRSFPWSVTSE